MTDYDAQKLLTLEQEGAGMCTAVEEAVDEICRRGFQTFISSVSADRMPRR